MSIHKINRINKPYRVIFKDVDGKKKSKTFSTKFEAETFETNIKNQTKMPQDLQFSTLERAEFAKIKMLCDNCGRSLGEAYSTLKLHFAHSTKEDISIESAMLKVLGYKEKMGVRAQTLNFYRVYSKRFEKFCEENKLLLLSQITETMAQAYIDAEKSKEHSRNAMRAFWTYFKKEGLARAN